MVALVITAVQVVSSLIVVTSKVAGSIPDGVIEIFHRHNPYDRTVTLG